MSKAKKYTIETLLPLNVSYDDDHGLTQEDVDMVNSLVEVIESTRSKHTPKIGDRVVYTLKGGEYHPQTLIGPTSTLHWELEPTRNHTR